MIDQRTFTKEWIENRSEYFKKGKAKGNIELIEKVISALYLLECLVSQNINFIFKGGTSLMLLLEKLHRFSIDIDIILEDANNIENTFEKIIKDNFIFNKYEKIVRKNDYNIPKEHYKFYFNSVLNGKEKYILLDILFDENPYIETSDKEIGGEFLILNDDNLMVKIPTVDCILGDKLTAFAPNTTGIPYGVGKELEIIKQLFDISNLFDQINSINDVNQTFHKIAEKELRYRNLKNSTPTDVLEDIYDTSLIIAARGGYKKDDFKQLELGVHRVKSYIFSCNFIMHSCFKH